MSPRMLQESICLVTNFLLICFSTMYNKIRSSLRKRKVQVKAQAALSSGK